MISLRRRRFLTNAFARLADAIFVRRERSRGSLPRAFALQLADFAQIQVALQSAHAEDEQHPVEMIELMLKRAGQQLFPVHLEPLALLVLCTNANFCGT